MSKTKKIARFHVLLSNLKIREQKLAILHGFGVDSTKELTEAQLDQVIERLVSIEAGKKKDHPANIRKLRSQVLNHLTKLGIYQDDNDWSKVNAFLMQSRVAGKLLYEMSEEELRALVRKLYAMRKKIDAARDEENYKATNN